MGLKNWLKKKASDGSGLSSLWSKKNKKSNKLKTKRKTPAEKAGLSEDQIKTAKKRTKTFKKDRKIKDKGQKSYNKGKDKKDWVDSAYERRQKDADTAMRDAARKRHEAWLKKNKRGKYSDKAIANAKKKENKSRVDKVMSDKFLPNIK